MIGHVARSGQSYVSDPADADRFLHPFVEREGIGSFVHVPIALGPRLFGVLTASHEEPGYYGPEELARLEALAPPAAGAIANALDPRATRWSASASCGDRSRNICWTAAGPVNSENIGSGTTAPPPRSLAQVRTRSWATARGLIHSTSAVLRSNDDGAYASPSTADIERRDVLARLERDARVVHARRRRREVDRRGDDAVDVTHGCRGGHSRTLKP